MNYRRLRVIKPISINRIAKNFCDSAGELIIGDRGNSHGDAKTNFQTIADLWSTYLDVKISASQVPRMMVLLKMARVKSGQFNQDDYVDMCGYSALAGEIATMEQSDEGEQNE